MPLPGYRFANKLGPNVPNNILINLLFCPFASFLIVSLTRLINKSNRSSYLIIFMTSFTPSSEIINVVTPDLNFLLRITASVADSAAVHPNGFKKPLASGLSTFPITGKPGFNNGPKSLPK